MIVFGLLIAAAAAAFASLLIAYNTSGGPEYTVSMFDQDMVTLNSLAIFCAGLAIALIFCAGLALAATGPRTRRRMGAGRGAHRMGRSRGYAVVEGDPAARRDIAGDRPESAQEWQADPDARPARADAPQQRQEPPEPPQPPIENPHNR